VHQTEPFSLDLTVTARHHKHTTSPTRLGSPLACNNALSEKEHSYHLIMTSPDTARWQELMDNVPLQPTQRNGDTSQCPLPPSYHITL